MTLDAHLTKLDQYLARFRETGILNRIGGKDQAGGGGTFATISPVDKSTICRVAHGTADDIDAAAQAAHAAFAHAVNAMNQSYPVVFQSLLGEDGGTTWQREFHRRWPAVGQGGTKSCCTASATAIQR